VDDLVDRLIALMNTDDVSPAVNLGNTGEFTMLEFATKVLGIVGSDVDAIHQPLRSDDPVRRKPNIDQAQRLLGWSPTVPLDEGRNRTVEYFRELPNA
jgi:UDP-glucuronate decarboxylase